jgi:hypothetical protein
VGTVADWIKPRVLELVYTSWSLLPFAVDAVEEGVGNREVESREERVIAYWKHHFPNSLLATPYSPSSPFPPSPFAWEPERRFALRCELDAAFFHLYGIGRDDADYILETFPIVKRHDEQEFGQYRTKRVILERYEEYAGAMGRQNPAGFDLGQVMANAIAETMPIRESGAPTASTSSKASSAAPKVRVYEEAPTFEKRDTDEVEWMCEIRKLFSTGGARDRDTAIKELATALGYERVGPVIGETISNAFTTAVKRGVIENEGGSLKLLRRNLYEYFLDFLKDQFLAALEGNSWREHDDAIRGFARWMGYAKTSPQIDEKARSIINGLIRENRLEAEGTRIRRGF